MRKRTDDGKSAAAARSRRARAAAFRVLVFEVLAGSHHPHRVGERVGGFAAEGHEMVW